MSATEATVTPALARATGIAILAIALVPVIVGTILFVASLEPNLHTWRRVGDIDALAGLLVLGGVIFPIATILACRREGIRDPTPGDHFRQSSILYAALMLAVLVLANNRDSSGSLAYAIAVLTAGAALAGVIANALTLAARGINARAN